HPDRRRPHQVAAGRGGAGAHGALPHAGLLPADRGDRFRSRYARCDRGRDAACPHIGAAGPPHRPRRDRLDGKEEARGVFLMARVANLAIAAVDEGDVQAKPPVAAAAPSKTLLRFLTCGSVDDGKSTLIGRLLYDTKLIFEDQLAALERDSRRHGTTGADMDLALLVDGLDAEREQGITIDVAYRFFATEKRKFIVADTPGHEQYTRNMATGASTADLAIVLVDARQGILRQTRRHAFIASLLGIRHIVLAVNKIDLVDFDQAVFDGIVEDYRAFSQKLGF